MTADIEKIVSSAGIIVGGYLLTLLIIRGCAQAVAAAGWPRAPFPASILLEVLAAALLADVNSGTFHFAFDHGDAGEQLRQMMPTNSKEARAVEDSVKFTTSSAWERFIWKFQIHHSVLWPRSVTKRSSSQKQLNAIGAVGCTLAILAACIGVEVWACRVIFFSFFFSAQVQRTHFWCHERNHSPDTVPLLVRWGQDLGLLLHPSFHRIHHERYDCNFPIFNGWTNLYVQALYKLCVQCGIVDRHLGQKPTIIGPNPSCNRVG